jgi:hypothetical protein
MVSHGKALRIIVMSILAAPVIAIGFDDSAEQTAKHFAPLNLLLRFVYGQC